MTSVFFIIKKIKYLVCRLEFKERNILSDFFINQIVDIYTAQAENYEKDPKQKEKQNLASKNEILWKENQNLVKELKNTKFQTDLKQKSYEETCDQLLSAQNHCKSLEEELELMKAKSVKLEEKVSNDQELILKYYSLINEYGVLQDMRKTNLALLFVLKTYCGVGTGLRICINLILDHIVPGLKGRKKQAYFKPYLAVKTNLIMSLYKNLVKMESEIAHNPRILEAEFDQLVLYEEKLADLATQVSNLPEVFMREEKQLMFAKMINKIMKFSFFIILHLIFFA